MLKNFLKVISIIILSIILAIIFSGCANEEQYNYNKINVKAVVNEEVLTEQFDEAFRTVYFYPKTDTKSYLYIIKETERDEYSLKTATDYLSSMKDILKNGYQMSKKETITSKKKNKQFICTYEYSAKDAQDNIYTAKTKYIYDTETKDALMIICFVDDKENISTKEAFYKLFDSVKLLKEPTETINKESNLEKIEKSETLEEVIVEETTEVEKIEEN